MCAEVCACVFVWTLSLSVLAKLPLPLLCLHRDQGPMQDMAMGVDSKDAQARTALLCSAEGGHVACLDLCLSAGAVHTTTQRDGRNALMLAAWRGHADAVKRLLEVDAIPGAAGASGCKWEAGAAVAAVASLAAVAAIFYLKVFTIIVFRS